MNPFDKLMNDIFANKDFLDNCYINGISYDCIVTNIEDGIAFSEVGMESEETFTLDLKLPLNPYPKKNDQVMFKDKLYKISEIVPDTAFKSIKLHLIALSKGIGK